jgi:hypothetical protein
MTSRLDLGNFQNLLEVMGNKITNSKTNALQGSIIYEILEDSPKFSNLALLSDIRRVDQEEVRLGSESINGFLDGFLDVFEFGWEVLLLARFSWRWGTDLASFPIRGRNMVYRQCGGILVVRLIPCILYMNAPLVVTQIVSLFTSESSIASPVSFSVPYPYSSVLSSITCATHVELTTYLSGINMVNTIFQIDDSIINSSLSRLCKTTSSITVVSHPHIFSRVWRETRDSPPCKSRNLFPVIQF